MRTTRRALLVLFGLILAGMLAITVRASRSYSILDVGPPLTQDAWFHATLADAYFGFITFYVWVAYKEAKWRAKLGWFMLIMVLGNIAMSVYMLIQLLRWNPDEGIAALVLRSPTEGAKSPD